MNSKKISIFNTENFQNLLCPNLEIHWKLIPVPDSGRIQLQAIKSEHNFSFSATEGYALQHFNSKFTFREVQEKCKQQFDDEIKSDFIVQLLEKLVALRILKSPEDSRSPLLKPAVKWIWHPDIYWLLRLQTKDSVAYTQINNNDKNLILELGKLPIDNIVAKYKINPLYVQDLLKELAVKGMLEGIETPKQKKKFNLLFSTFRLFNPDNWLNRHINKIRFMFTTEFCLLLCIFLGFSIVISFAEYERIYDFGQKLWNSQGFNLTLPFALLMMLVVSIHELGHAFTLKHYKGVVLEMGLMFIFLLPGAYTNTTDAYGLVKRKQRTLVMAAGVICQIVIWGFALCLWSISTPGSWFSTTTYLLMIAAQFTLALNLNPLNKFDGYHILEAMTGINHLRKKSFAYYAEIWRGETSQERTEDIGILAVYAPACLLYVAWLLVNLFFWVWHLSTPYLPGK